MGTHVRTVWSWRWPRLRRSRRAMSGSTQTCPAPIPPVNDVAEPVHDGQRLLQAARRAQVGLDQRRRRRQGRQVDLGRRALRREQLPRSRRPARSRTSPTVLKFDDDRQAGDSASARPADLPARHPRRPRRQHLGDRRPGQRAARRRAARRRPAAQAAGRPVRRRAAGGRRRGGAPTLRQPPRADGAATKGHQVFKFSPDGKVLMTLGKPGGAIAPGDCCFQPNDVITAPDGKFIFVVRRARQHAGWTAQVLKFDEDRQVHQGVGQVGQRRRRVRSAARAGVRLEGAAVSSATATTTASRSSIRTASSSTSWYQFSRPSGIYIDKNDNLYVADSESKSVSRNHQDWKRGIRIGSLKDRTRSGLHPRSGRERHRHQRRRRRRRSTRRATSTAPRSARSASTSTSRSKPHRLPMLIAH